MDMRQFRALELAARMRITLQDGAWIVPSQSSSDSYKVALKPDGNSCTCPDFELTAKDCKHIVAAQFVKERDYSGQPLLIDTSTLPAKKIYRQNWPAYNVAQATEKRRLQVLLVDLCRNLPEPDRTHRRGQKPHLVKDAIFAMAFKVYCGLSSRRFSTDLLEAHKQGHITKPIPGVKVTAFFENPEFTPVLKELIAVSAAPLKAVEASFAIDSSGFATSRFDRWFDVKQGVNKRKCVWVKTHLACGTKTNVVTAVRILDKDAADCPQFIPLVQDTARCFTINEVSADKAYASLENFEAVAGFGGTGYMAFKSNTTGGVGGLFEKMFHYFQFNRDEYLAHYHKRSNVESTFSAVKRKFGDSVMSRSDTGMVNEVLCKLLCHNLSCLIHEQEELGIVPVFWKDEEATGSNGLPVAATH